MKKILIIEDEPYIREGTALLLEDQGFNPITAEDGSIGIQMAFLHKPDLIICDVMMPNVDGYGVINKLRQDPETAHIPFIFLTAKIDRTSTRMGMNLGADDYLTKPFTLDELLSAVNARITKQEQLKRHSEEKLENLRKNIIYSLPHELMTPLNGILGPIELLEQMYDSFSKEEALEMITMIRKSGDRLHRLVQNYLLYAQLDLVSANTSAINGMRDCTTSEGISTIEYAAQHIAQSFERTEDFHFKGIEGNLVFQIDQEHLYKIITELTDNAFKFSNPHSKVQITCTQKGLYCWIEVTDRGRGMSKNAVETIGAYMQFERRIFEQQGTGFGLIIAKRLVELHGGELIIESEPNVLTNVRFSLPISGVA
ncbi:MAG: response regulator [Ignavibacteria bacterium]|nr:response regulator [Ignavibacteria bacterium]